MQSDASRRTDNQGSSSPKTPINRIKPQQRASHELKVGLHPGDTEILRPLHRRHLRNLAVRKRRGALIATVILCRHRKPRGRSRRQEGRWSPIVVIGIRDTFVRGRLGVWWRILLCTVRGEPSDEPVIVAVVVVYGLNVFDRLESSIGAALRCVKSAGILSRQKGDWVFNPIAIRGYTPSGPCGRRANL